MAMMNLENKVLFSETHKIKFNLEIIMLSVLTIGAIIVFYLQVIDNQEGITKFSDNTLTVALFLWLIFAIANFNSRIDLKIKEKGIYYKFYPFQSFKRILWEDVVECTVQEYDPNKHMRGFGLRIFQKDAVLTIQGNHGLHIETKTGAKILVGTLRPQELTNALNQITQQLKK